MMRRKASLLIFFTGLCLASPPARGQEAHGTLGVRTIDLSGVQRLISERHGRILFLNIWATWCQPCVEEFPDIVRVRSDFADSVLDVVAISIDYPDEVESKILPFLKDHHAAFPVYVSSVKKEEDFMDAINPAWTGGIPATFVFDRQGGRRAFLFGEKKFTVFKATIDSVLAGQ
jgi:thiol-disulfide isomerase/thioredoxin